MARTRKWVKCPKCKRHYYLYTEEKVINKLPNGIPSSIVLNFTIVDPLDKSKNKTGVAVSHC